MDWFVGAILQDGKNIKPVRLRNRWSAAGLADGGTSLVERISCWVEVIFANKGTHN